MSKHRAEANRFMALVKRAGACVSTSYASTGSIYVEAWTGEGIIKVRFADHGEWYCREDISVDPDGCSYEQAIRATIKATGLNLSRSLASIKAAETRRSKAKAKTVYKLIESEHDIRERARIA